MNSPIAAAPYAFDSRHQHFASSSIAGKSSRLSSSFWLSAWLLASDGRGRPMTKKNARTLSLFCEIELIELNVSAITNQPERY